MKISILHNAVGPDAGADEADVLDQVEAVSRALVELGMPCRVVPCTLDLADLARELRQHRPDAVFNLVESLDGSDRLLSFVPALLEHLRLPYTGSSAEALTITGSKLLTKERLRSHQLPMPEIYASWPPREESFDVARPGDRAILKSTWGHGSLGLDDDAIVDATSASLADRLAAAASRLGGAAFAERFVEGREINLSLLTGPDGPIVLPPQEIVFEGYPAGKPHIVGYTAKWDPGSFEYNASVRRFDFPPQDAGLFAELAGLARRCWTIFGLGGYARVDFRVGADGPAILEVNSNPCLSPDAGFAVALERAGIRYAEGIRRILGDLVGSSRLANAVVHNGSYETGAIGTNVRRLFEGLAQSSEAP